MRYLKTHPFAVEAFFKCSTVLTFAVPKEYLIKYIPECLSLDTYQDKWAFIAIAMVQTKNLRPKGFPKLLGQNFFLIGYRIFVRYRSNDGRSLRGLYILKSETDKKRMEIMGNVFTHYNYTTTDINLHEHENFRTIHSERSQFFVTIDDTDQEVDIPDGSPFNDWKDARKFSGPLPHTFTYNKKEGSVLIILGVRQNWTPKPIQVKDYKFAYLDKLDIQKPILANAFEIRDVPYHWKKGEIQPWK